MRERQILFSGPMVRAVLDGTKTMTRRVVKPQPENPEVRGVSPIWGWGVPRLNWAKGRFHLHAAFNVDGKRVDRWLPCPYGAPGDRLWVREAWASGFAAGCWGTIFAADGKFVQGKRDHKKGPHYNANDRPPIKWRPSIFLPRWASRITLEITGVRVERVQDITGEDAMREGISQPRCGCETCARSAQMCPADASSHVEEFAHLWDTINGKRAPWASNPWVWVIEFRRLP